MTESGGKLERMGNVGESPCHHCVEFFRDFSRVGAKDFDVFEFEMLDSRFEEDRFLVFGFDQSNGPIPKKGERNTRETSAGADVGELSLSGKNRQCGQGVHEMFGDELFFGFCSDEIDLGVVLEEKVGVADKRLRDDRYSLGPEAMRDEVKGSCEEILGFGLQRVGFIA